MDISKARQLLGWVPPVSVDEGLRRAMGALDCRVAALLALAVRNTPLRWRRIC